MPTTGSEEDRTHPDISGRHKIAEILLDVINRATPGQKGAMGFPLADRPREFDKGSI